MTELLANFKQDKATHISNHIQEWWRWKWLIKAYILNEFLLEWFLKSLQPYISNDVSLSRVFSEEQAIFRAQKLELIYSQSGVLNKNLPDAPHSKLDLSKTKLGPHGDGIIGSIDSGAASLLNQLQQLSIQSASSGQATPSVPTSSQDFSIDVVQTSNPKGNQKSKGKNKG